MIDELIEQLAFVCLSRLKRTERITCEEEQMNPKSIRADFPFFAANPDLAYLDSSATSQTPACVIERLARYDLLEKASPFRGMYTRSVRATEDYEHARDLVRSFIGASSSREIRFDTVRGSSICCLRSFSG